MSPGRNRRDSRYKVHGNVEAQYMDAAETVLVNTPGIGDARELQVREEEGLSKAYGKLLREVRTDTVLNCGLLLYIHESIFGDLYEWAGRWRTVSISKPGIMWPPPDFLEKGMQGFEETVLRRYPASALRSDEVFCRAIAHIQGEFLAIHPFREGNARTIKLATNLLAAQTKRPPLRYDEGKGGQRRYITAAQAAIGRDFDPMTEIISAALRAAAPRP
jgi:cell filamentation protein